VYRGQEYERIGSFNQRMQAQFPDAQVWMTVNNCGLMSWLFLFTKMSQIRLKQVAPCKRIQDSLEFWIPHIGFRILGAGFQCLSVELRL